jgi:hypothetical protein
MRCAGAPILLRRVAVGVLLLALTAPALQVVE